MCFIIAIVSLVLSFNFFSSENTPAALGSLGISIFFIMLMIRNILHVKKLKEGKKDDN